MASVVVAAMTLVAALASWGGLAWLLTNVPPSRPLAVLAAYVFAFAAITSTGALLAWLALEARPTSRPASKSQLPEHRSEAWPEGPAEKSLGSDAASSGGRQRDARRRSPASYFAHSMLPALLVLFAMWLQALRTLTPVVGVLLIGLYAFLELAVLFGTRGSVELPVRQ